MKHLRKYPPGIAFRLALSKYISKFHIVIPEKYFLINYYGGKIYLNLKESHMMIQRALGVYEYWKTYLFMNLVKPGMTIIDVGANKGYFSLLFAKLMNDQGKVLSFEPDPNNCFWIRKSISANRYKCIRLHQLALSDKDGIATFYPGKKSGWGSLFPGGGTAPNKKPFTVKTQRLDSFLRDEGIDHVDVIKIDVEGADLLVLRGAENTLKKSETVKLIMDIDVKNENDRIQLFKILTSYGFSIYGIGRELKPIKKITDLEGNDIYATKTD